MLYTFDDYTVDTRRATLWHAGQPIHLERLAFALLVYLGCSTTTAWCCGRSCWTTCGLTCLSVMRRWNRVSRRYATLWRTVRRRHATFRRCNAGAIALGGLWRRMASTRGPPPRRGLSRAGDRRCDGRLSDACWSLSSL